MGTPLGKLASGLALVLLSGGLGGCNLLGSEKTSEANDSAPNAPQEVSAEGIQPQEPAAKPETKTVIAASPLTRPTDPDIRVKAVKTGRSNPFANLVGTAPTKAQPLETNSGTPKNPSPSSGSTANKKPSTPASPKSALGSKPSPITRAPKSTKTNDLPPLENPAKAGGNNDEIVLPPLPEPTLAKQVSVQGVMMLGGQPKAIVKAPNEQVARTVQAGDYLANGQILVASINMSNPQTPQIVLQESGQTVTVGVGSQSESLASTQPF